MYDLSNVKILYLVRLLRLLLSAKRFVKKELEHEFSNKQPPYLHPQDPESDFSIPTKEGNNQLDTVVKCRFWIIDSRITLSNERNHFKDIFLHILCQ